MRRADSLLSAPHGLSSRARKLPLIRDPSSLALIAFGVLCLAFPLLANAYLVGVAFNALVLIILAISWNLIGGVARQPSFGHAAFFGAGSYSAACLLLYAHQSYVVALIGAAIAGGLLAVPMSPSFRARGVYFAILTLALAETLDFIATQRFPGGVSGLTLPVVFRLTSDKGYYIALIITALAFATSALVARSHFGLSLRAIGADIGAAEASGVPTLLCRTNVLVVSGVLAGVAGALYSLQQTFIDPSIAFDPTWSILAILACVLGGVGTLSGPLVGAVAWSLLNWCVGRLPNPGAYTIVIYGAALTLLAIGLPTGILGAISRGLGLVRRLCGHSGTSQEGPFVDASATVPESIKEGQGIRG